MVNMGKKYKKSLELVDLQKQYPLEDAFAIMDKFEVKKFDETVDAVFRLGVDPKQSDQMVRGVTPLPHGLGKKVRIVVFAKGEKDAEARAAGADFVGADDLIEKIKEGWMEFDKAIATPDMMGVVSKVGKILGPRGLMPNPKLGSVTFDVKKAVADSKAGQVEYRVDKAGNVHAPIGKRSFGKDKLRDNFITLYEAILRAKPPSSKGTYLRNISISSTMSPGIAIDAGSIKLATA